MHGAPHCSTLIVRWCTPDCDELLGQPAITAQLGTAEGLRLEVVTPAHQPEEQWSRHGDLDRGRPVEGVGDRRPAVDGHQDRTRRRPGELEADLRTVGKGGSAPDDVTQPGRHLVEARLEVGGVVAGRPTEGQPHVVLVHVAVEVTDTHEPAVALVPADRSP